MKMNIWIIGCILALQAPLAFAGARPGAAEASRLGGAGDAGGGHGFSSTPEEVRAYASNLSERAFSQLALDMAWVYFRLELSQLMSPDYAPNETLKRIDLAIQRAYSGKDMYDEFKKIKLVPQSSCKGEHGEVVDSSTGHKLGSPICLNVNALARYPSEALATEMIALLFHEWSHQLGFGENEAIEFQNYVKHYEPIIIPTLDEPRYGQPIRVGGSQKFTAPDGSSVTVRCYPATYYQKEGLGMGPNATTVEVILLAGQTFRIRAVKYGDTHVSCGDAPELACSAPVKGLSGWCDGNTVTYGTGKYDNFCVDDPKNPDGWKLADLYQARICRQPDARSGK